MVKPVTLAALVSLLACASAFAQGPCATQSGKLACVLPQEYGTGGAFNQVLDTVAPVIIHFISKATSQPR